MNLGPPRRRRFEILGAHPLFIDIDRQVFGLVGIPGLKRPEIGWTLDQYMIAGVEENLADEIECLLRSARDQDVVRVDDNPVPARVAGDHLAERRLAFRRAVLKRVRTALVEDPPAGAA